MGILRKLTAGGLAGIGYLLSPLSWWNDLYVNLPISYVLAAPFGLLNEKAFNGAFVAFYWLSNIAGLILLHKGATAASSDPDKKPVSPVRALIVDILVSIAYTAVVIALISLGILRTPKNYLGP